MQLTMSAGITDQNGTVVRYTQRRLEFKQVYNTYTRLITIAKLRTI